MQEETVQLLQSLKEQALDSLIGVADQLADDDQMSIDALLAIARTTGRVKLLSKALEKCRQMPDSPDKADLLLELLNEIESQLAITATPEPDQQETNVESPADSEATTEYHQ